MAEAPPQKSVSAGWTTNSFGQRIRLQPYEAPLRERDDEDVGVGVGGGGGDEAAPAAAEDEATGAAAAPEGSSS